MKAGYSLIEVAVGLVLASMLGTLLFRTFSQLQLSSGITDSFMDSDTSSAHVVYHMTRDIAGAFVPQAARVQAISQPEKEPDKKVGEAQKAPEKSPEKSPAPSLDMASVFMLKHKDKNLDTLTCITCNPFVEYDHIKPRIARVVYRLVDDTERQGAFKLMRQESTTLNLKEFEKNKVKAYTLAQGIKSCSCTCTLLEYPEKKKPEEEVVPTAKIVADWVFDPQKAKEQKMVPLPYAVTITCVFVDNQGHREWPVTFSVPIASFVPFGVQQRPVPKISEPPKKPELPKLMQGKDTTKPSAVPQGVPTVQHLKFRFPHDATQIAKRK